MLPLPRLMAERTVLADLARDVRDVVRRLARLAWRAAWTQLCP